MMTKPVSGNWACEASANEPALSCDWQENRDNPATHAANGTLNPDTAAANLPVVASRSKSATVPLRRSLFRQ